MTLSFKDIFKAQKRLQGHIAKTPILTNQLLNQELGAEIYFKCENFQKTGSFKFRGAANKILKFKEDFGHLPTKIVAVSSGNHAQAVAYLASQFGIKAIIFMEQKVSPYKVEVTKKYGAEVVLTKNRQDADLFAQEKIKEGYLFIHPSDDEDIVCGQGTACLEAIEEVGEFDAIFTPCSGGGLVIGSYIAAGMQKNKPLVFAVEPLVANDAAISFRTGKLFSFEESQNSIADGAMVLKLSDYTYSYFSNLDGVYEIPEEEIIRWTQIVSTNLKVFVEPTGILGMAGCAQFLKEQKLQNNSAQKSGQNSGKNLKILVILSGGNMSAQKASQIWQKAL
ncbi:MAG: threonine dehydratase [Rickettsiales bacterium]|jgi:threonine dehydratase